MGFGANLFFVFVLLPLTIILIIYWIKTAKKGFGMTLAVVWFGAIGMAIVGGIAERMRAKIVLEKKDYYGHYVIDRSFFPGKQADWQYNSFRFEIKSNDSLYFYVTDSVRTLKFFKGFISTVKPYSSERLSVNMNQPTHHILTSNPTVYRDTRKFILVFNSPKFGNVFFTKGTWAPLKEKASP
jgi:hypothetical protein